MCNKWHLNPFLDLCISQFAKNDIRVNSLIDLWWIKYLERHYVSVWAHGGALMASYEVEWICKNGVNHSLKSALVRQKRQRYIGIHWPAMVRKLRTWINLSQARRFVRRLECLNKVKSFLNYCRLNKNVTFYFLAASKKYGVKKFIDFIVVWSWNNHNYYHIKKNTII